MEAAPGAGTFLYANQLSTHRENRSAGRSRPGVHVPLHFGKNLDALYDCMTDLVTRPAPSQASWWCWSRLPTTPFDKGTRAARSDIFRDTADNWANGEDTLQVFLFSSPFSQEQRVMGRANSKTTPRTSPASRAKRSRPMPASSMVDVCR